MFDKKNFGKRLYTLRQNKNISQQDLANHFQITKSSISMMESGQRGPSAEVLYALADYFDVSLDYLVGRSEVKERR